jgi:vanillate O-demethylase monooxygenase subunit
VIGFFLQPETADSCRLYTTLWRDDLDGDTGRMAEAVAFEKAVLDEDLAIQTAFDRLVLPLERTTELHTRADRSTLELRRVLAELVEAAEAG